MLSFVGADSPAFFDMRGQITKANRKCYYRASFSASDWASKFEERNRNVVNSNNNDGTISDWTLGMIIIFCLPPK